MADGWVKNKCYVIIGGTGGMGLSTANALVSEGACVVVAGSNTDHTKAAARLLGENGHAITGNAEDEHLADRCIEACVKNFGAFNGLYHVAGGSGRKFGDGPLHKLTLKAWQDTFQLNLTSLMFSNRAAIQYFLEQKQEGVILNMSSVLAQRPSPKHFTTHAYAAAKSAITGFSISLAATYAPNNIRVNVIAPSLIETPMSARAMGNENIMQFIHTKQPLDGGRAGMPEDVDGAAVFLLSGKAKFITGQIITVDGGWSVSDGQYN